ncbi:uncharacterized protein LOC141673354 [Apium graveolens]|uniref:uncharacterized protein LOC141673354 n=1 Tax=Apium graveolens TaxID=4045 RepID=UPI003D7AE89E
MEMKKAKDSIGLSYPMLTRSNYTAWALKMKVFIQAQGVWIALEPNDPKGAVEEKIDKVAMAMIYQGIPEETLLSLVEKKTTKKVWEMIKTLNQGADRVKQAQIQTLKYEFEMLSMKESDHIDDFHMKLNGIITSTLEQFGNLETMIVEEVVGSLKAHEERVKGKSEAIENQLLLTEEEWAKREGEEKKLLLIHEEWIKKNSGERSSGFKADYKKPKRKKEQKQEANMSMIDDDEPALLLAKHDKEKHGLMLHENKVTWFFWQKVTRRTNEALGAFKKFCALVEKGPGQECQNFLNRQGRGVSLNNFKEFCESKGIERHYTTPYTPQQNGMVERRNRIVVEMARSSLKEMKMPIKLWGEANDDNTGDLLRTPLAFRENENALDRENYDDSVTPKKTRLISELYNEIEEVEIDEELCLMGIYEP